MLPETLIARSIGKMAADMAADENLTPVQTAKFVERLNNAMNVLIEEIKSIRSETDNDHELGMDPSQYEAAKKKLKAQESFQEKRFSNSNQLNETMNETTEYGKAVKAIGDARWQQ